MTSIILIWSLTIHRHQKQLSINYSWDHTGFWRMVAKIFFFHSKIVPNLKILDFFPWGLWCQNCKKTFLFFKSFKNKFQKWMPGGWDHSKVDKNKVKNFVGPSPYPVEMLFMVVQVIIPPTPHLCNPFGIRLIMY